MRKNPEFALVALLVFAAIVLVRFAPNDMTNGDSFGSLLTSQAILLDGTLALDAYPELADPANYKYEKHGDRIFYALGFGPSVLCVPAVWGAHRLGLDMAEGDDTGVQRILAALTVGAVLLIVWLMARLLLPPVWAIGFAFATVFGTSLSSTLGTAMWNMGFETVGIFGALYLVIRHGVQGAPLRPLLVGLLLGLAFFCRPTASLAVGCGGIYVLAAFRRGLWKYAVGVGLWLIVLVVISRLSYGMWIPPYYQALGMELTWRPEIVLQGILVSPGRGLFVFSPVILMVLIWLAVRARKIPHGRLAIGCVAWFGLHVLLMLRFNHWWGGHCFGPRLLTDALPALVPLGLLVVVDARSLVRPVSRRLALGGLMTLAALGVGAHAVQGLYNPETQLWNSQPNIDPYVRHVFDWRFPQPISTPRSRLDRRVDIDLPQMVALAEGQWEGPEMTESLRYYGWSAPKTVAGGEGFRALEKSVAYIAVVLADAPAGSLTGEISLEVSLEISLEVSLAIAPGAIVTASWNGVELDELGPGDGGFSVYRLLLAPEVLATPRHGGTSYPLVPKPLRVSYNGNVAHEMEFKVTAAVAKKAIDRRDDKNPKLRFGGLRWVVQH